VQALQCHPALDVKPSPDRWLGIRRGHPQAEADGNHQQGSQESEPERLLTPEVAATRFGVKKRWLLDHADEIPGVKRLSRKTIRFSERRLARFLERNTA
jgi:hypothetical protein